MLGGFTGLEWLSLLQIELLLFAGSFFVIGALDELTIDLYWLWLKLKGRVPDLVVDPAQLQDRALSGWPAVFIPAWQEDQVIGQTIRHMLEVWPQAALRLYVGVYANDAKTMAAAMAAARGDTRLRIIVHDAPGPSSKADCLNRIYRALSLDEERMGARARIVLLHDAEDMVHPDALPLIDAALDETEFVQLPVMPIRHPKSRWVSGHYLEEFAEAHGKTMVVRAALGADMPLAGVGCGVERDALARLAADSQGRGPFADDSITEDYELGINLSRSGARARFLRARCPNGELIATRAYFPTQLDAAIRQKARWIHGISLQGWDRLGWDGGIGERWMRLRDRRGAFVAMLLGVAYLSLILFAISWIASGLGFGPETSLSPTIKVLLWANAAALIWRASWRFAFTAREYGMAEGALALMRIPLANVIAIIAGRKAIFSYLATLFGGPLVWDKTTHDAHPIGVPPERYMT